MWAVHIIAYLTFLEECHIPVCSLQWTLSRWLTAERISPETSFWLTKPRHLVYVTFSHPKAKFHHLNALKG